MPETPDINELQDQVFDLVRRSQEAMLDAGRAFTDSIRNLAPGELEQVDRLIDDAFEFTERVLKTQREFAKSVVQAVTAPLGGGGAGEASGEGSGEGSSDAG